MKSTFLICPVRGCDPMDTQPIVEKLESEGWVVHWPPRDTDQVDDTGLRICTDNARAIKDADAVHFVWDGKSQGSLFDLGVAFAFKKKIIPIEIPPLTEGKSFQNMVTMWSQSN
jgi:nucleoside 2-deoxyribosyltransferase